MSLRQLIVLADHRELALRSQRQGVDNPDMSDVIDGIQRKARDHGRNPMQWDDSPHGGFTKVGAKPWMRVHDDYTEWNVKAQEGDQKSVLEFWKSMLAFRKKHLSSVGFPSYLSSRLTTDLWLVYPSHTWSWTGVCVYQGV